MEFGVNLIFLDTFHFRLLQSIIHRTLDVWEIRNSANSYKQGNKKSRMMEPKFEDRIFYKYLRLLNIGRQEPDFEYIKEIVKAHVSRIPFENISKLLFKKRFNSKHLIDFEAYLEGIERYNFGGTCYSNNFYLNQLLSWLGYDIKLCGADMKSPDVHLVNIVAIENNEFLIDTGYSAPFSEPLPLNSLNEYSIDMGNDHYVLKPQNKNGHPQIELFRNGILKHGYIVNPRSRNIDEFQQVIEDSFEESAVFMNALLLSRFDYPNFITIHNMKIIESCGVVSKEHSLVSIDELTSVIENRFGIPRAIVIESIEGLQMQKDAWN